MDQSIPYPEVNAILHSESGAGAYNSFDRWSASLRDGSVSSGGSRLVTAHEALHATLNGATAYGTLLASAVLLARTAGGPYRARLPVLVGWCRGVHEAFATFESLWLTVGGDQAYLADYPAYQRWYRNASELVPLPDHSRRKDLMVEAAVLACMQAPVLTALADDAGPDGDVWSPPLAYRPDRRFSLLHRAADAAFWARAWRQCEEQIRGTDFAAAIEASDADPSRRPTTFADEFDETVGRCGRLLYAEVGRLLRSLEAPTLDYDGHRKDSAAVVESVVRACPEAAGMLVAPSDDRSVREEWFPLWQQERLVLRERPRTAIVRRYADVLRTHRTAGLLSRHEGSLHVFATVRPAGRLLEQFAMEEAEAQVLRGLEWAPVVTLRATEGGDAPVELSVVDRPDELAELARALPAGVTMHVNVSLACLGDEVWWDRWASALVTARLTALVDLSPADQLDIWRQDNQALAFARADLRDLAGEPASLLVLVLRDDSRNYRVRWPYGRKQARSPRAGLGRAHLTARGRPDSSLPLLILCTSVVGYAIKQYIEDSFPGVTADPSLLGKSGGDIGVAVSHLLREESSFDFAAYPPTQLATPTLPEQGPSDRSHS